MSMSSHSTFTSPARDSTSLDADHSRGRLQKTGILPDASGAPVPGLTPPPADRDLAAQWSELDPQWVAAIDAATD